MSISYDCLYLQIAPDVPTLYFRMIWALVVPAGYIFLFLSAYAILILIGKAQYQRIVIYTMFIYMFLYLQPTIIGGFISLASSRNISGYGWVQADVSVRDDSSTHSAWMGGLIVWNLIVWTFILPSVWLALLYKNRHSLQDNVVRSRLGFFYNEYAN